MEINNSGKSVEILLVEDNPGDIRLTELALKRAKLENNLHVTKNGIEALNFLYKTGKYKDVPKPDLILLDLNLPKKSGQEVLKEVKSNDDLKRIPIIVMTTSDAEKDIIETYNLSVNAFITKPLDFKEFIRIISVIEDFWLKIVKLPPK